jgi:hypothetical protein
VSNRANKKKGNKNGTANASTSTTPTTPARLASQPQSLASTLRQHPVFLVVSFVVAALVAIATIVPATGYVEERWQETVATVDFSGEIDQQKPLTVPLVIANPSDIFSIHVPKISCTVDVEYSDGGIHHAVMFGDQGGVQGAEIAPHSNAIYFCDAPSAFTVASPGGPPIPIKQADISVILDYETWVPWAIPRQVTTPFVVITTSGGFRWIKGDWIAGHPRIPRPANLESMPPTFVYPGPKPP